MSNKSKPESIFTNIEKRNSFSSVITPTSILSPTSSYYISNSNSTTLDLSDLKEKDADVKAWINKMLSSSTNSKISDTNLLSDISPNQLNSPPSANGTNSSTDNNIPQQASILLIKLENAGQQISKSIEKISNEVVKNIPRVVYDIENIRKGAHTMQENINRVRMDYRKFNTDSSEVIQPMFLLDTIRLRMEETRKLLKEAENWSNLSSEMDDLFNNKEYDRAAVTLEDAQNSLSLLKNSSDYEEKHELLRKYLNRLEAELSPLLLQTIKSKDIQNLRKYQKIFKKINREKEFYNCYFRNVKQEILEYWMGFEVKDSEQQEVVVPITPVTPSTPYNKDDNEEGENEKQEEPANNVLIINSTNPQNLSFAEWVPSYFEELYSIIIKEFNWSSIIFQQPGDIVCHLINESNKYLKPPFTSRLESYKEIDKDHFIVSLINIYKTVEKFAQTIEHNILFQRDTNRFLKMSSFSSATHSKKQNSLNRFKKNYNLGNWGESLLEPFQSYQQDFANLELNYLISQLKQLFKPEVMAYKSPNELVDHLHLAVDNIFDQLNGTMKRCIEFTYGYACPGTLKIMNDYLVASLEKYSDIIRVIRNRTEIKSINKIREEHKMGMNSPLHSNSSINISGNLSKGSLMNQPNDSDEDLNQERNRQIWVNFELGFKLLGICCIFDKSIKNMEGPQLRQFFDRILLNRQSIDETQNLLSQLHTLLTLNHADSEYDLDAETPIEVKNTQKLFNSNGESGEDPTDATDITEDHSLTSKPEHTFGKNENGKQQQNTDQELSIQLPLEDPEIQQKRLQKSEKELALFQKLYQSPHNGSVLSREMIRLSSLNSYELRECIRIIAKQYYQTKETNKDNTTINENNTNDANNNVSTSATTEKPPISVIDINDLEPLPLDKIHSTILNNVKSRMAKITNECQRFIYDALFITIDEQLSEFYNREHWSHAASASNKISPFNFEIPQFSLSPSSYIVSIGEHLLSLPQHLELYLNDEALTYSVNTLPYCQPISLLTHSLLEDLNITPSTRINDDPFHQEGEDSEFEEPSGHMWIISLCNGTMVKYIKNIMKLKELTFQESKQLGTDIGYLMNVFGALEIYILPILSSIYNFSQMKDKELVERKKELEAILDKQYNIDSNKNSNENLAEELEKEKEQVSSSSSSMMMLNLTEHEEYELIKLFIILRNIN
eukprot:jgi/Orpsp1_1/1174254/evm.model.c7180000049411.1